MKLSRVVNKVWLGMLGVVLAFGWGQVAHGSIAFSASGSDYTASSSTAAVIPDNDPSGIAYSLNFATSGLNISSISVTLNISGGYNGDLYAYLSHGSQTLVLLDRVGVSSSSAYGFSTAGLNVILSDLGSANIHGVSSPTSGGTYLADGQTTSPLASSSSFSATGGSATFGNTFSGDPSGNWTLFFADVSGGGVSTLNGFSVDITAVPEPINTALGIFLGLWGALAGVGCLLRVRNKANQLPG